MFNRLFLLSHVFGFSLFLSSQVICQIEVDFNFIQYQEEYQPLRSGDTIWGVDNEKFGLVTVDFLREFQLNPPLVVKGAEDWVFDEIRSVITGATGFVSFENQTLLENILFLSPASTRSYVSPLIDLENEDQGFIIFKRTEDFIIIDFQNLAHSEELSLGTGNLISRFNFQIEYRISDSQTRYIYGPSIISTELEEYLRSAYVYTFFGFELSQYDEFGDWDDLYDVEVIHLFGLPEEPFVIKISSIDFWLPQISLTGFPSENTVYEFNILSPSSNNELVLLEDKIKFYPNPTDDFLMVDPIKEDLFDRDDVNFKIFSIDGKLILEQQLNQISQIDLRTFVPGAYLLKVSSDDFQAYGRILKK